jgi:HSP20 family protein
MARGELAPWRPFRDLERWARRFPNFFEDWPFGEREEYFPALESFVKNGNLTVRADVPGVDPKDIDVSIVGNVLTIKGERKEEKEVKSEDYIRREASYGAFERRMTLPEGANTEKIAANFKNGVVEITMPVAKAVEAKKVPLQVESAKSEK